MLHVALILAVLLICIGLVWFIYKPVYTQRPGKRRSTNRRDGYCDSGVYCVLGSRGNDGYYAASASMEFGGGSFGGGGAGGKWSGSDSCDGGDGGGGD